MKLFSVSILLGLLILTSCSNEIELNFDGGSTPVVYCLLNPRSNVQYVRLARTFLTDQATAGTIPVADSTIWSVPHEIYIEKYGPNDDVEDVVYFEPTIFPEKDSGLFPDNNYQLYKANFTPTPGAKYVLYVHFTDPEKLVSGKTIVMGLPKIIDPGYVLYRMITFDSLSALYVRWMPEKNGGLYQGIFRFHYAEKMGDDINNTYVDFPTPIYSGMNTDYTIEKKLNPNNFFTYLSKHIEVVEGIERIPIGIEYQFFSAGEDLALWYNTQNDNNSSQTSIFEYSNIEGGTGIFTSWVSQRVPNIPLSPVSIRNLKTHPLTKDLGFTDHKSPEK